MIAYFKTIPSLNQGDPVAVNGVVKGKVTSIDLEGDSVKVFFTSKKKLILKMIIQSKLRHPN